MKKGKREGSRFGIIVFVAIFALVLFSGASIGAKEKVLNYASYASHNNADPGSWSSYRICSFGPDTFENLLAFDENLNFKPRLAEKWEVSTDKLTYKFHLRKGVQFHHGFGEMKASDVVFSFVRMKDPATGSAFVSESIGIKNIKEIVAESDYTVKITLIKPDMTFLYKMAEWYVYIVSEKAVAKLGKDGFRLRPVGTGPFAYDKGDVRERYEIVRHEDYWGPKPKLDRITFITINEAATLHNSFVTGEIDIYPVNDVDKTLEYKKDPKYRIFSMDSKGINFVGMNMQIKPFDDIRVRKALALSINRDELLEFYFKGLSTAPDYMMTPLVRHGARGTYKHEYNPEKAKKLLAEAGYPNGVDTEFYCPGDAKMIGPATIVQSYLTQVGIRAKLMAVDFGVYINKVRTGKAPIWNIYNKPEGHLDPFIVRWTSSKYPGNNWCGIKDTKYDNIVEEAMAAPDEESKGKLFYKAQVRLAELLPWVSVEVPTTRLVMHKKVKGMQVTPDLKYSFKTVYIEE